MQCRNGQWVASKPIALPVRTEDPGTKGGAMGGGGGERYRLKPKTAVNVVLTWSESGSSTETEMVTFGTTNRITVILLFSPLSHTPTVSISPPYPAFYRG